MPDFKRGLKYAESHKNLVEAFGDDAPSKATVNNWFNEFKRGRLSLEDEAHPGRPTDAVTPENVRLVARMIKEHRNVTYVEIQEALGIGASTVNSILHEYLGVRKLTSR